MNIYFCPKRFGIFFENHRTLPFIVVLLHTYMDTIRSDDEREINHHGRAVTIGDNENNYEDGNILKVFSLSYFQYYIQRFIG